MDFALTDDQKMIRDTARSFVQKESPVERMRKLRDTELGYDPAVWQQMGELGWLGLPLPESVGGFGGTMIDASLVLEQLGSTLVPEPFLASVVLGGMAVVHGATEAQQKALLEPMIEGRASLALAYHEPGSRYDTGAVETTAAPADGGWTLRGTKSWVLNGHAADHLIVSAQTDAGLSLFRVDKGASGLTVQNVKTMDGGRAARVTMDGAPGELLGQDENALAFRRDISDYRCASIAEAPDNFDFGIALARQFYCDHFDDLRLARLAKSSWKPLAELGKRLHAEEQVHVHHADGWIRRLGEGDAESRTRIQNALDALPEELGRLMENVAVVVEDRHPSEDLLGLYEGVPLTERDDYGGFAMPDRVTVYRLPLLEMCGSEDELVDQVTITVIHELAHHFGIDDHTLHELGWG